ncbi:Protein of unknown function [Gryllus bimaculatus]|nr:Protein of unknown function [Gryllus bimaculatus]
MSDYYPDRDPPMPGFSGQQRAPASARDYSRGGHYSGHSNAPAASTSHNVQQYPTPSSRTYNAQNIPPNENHELNLNEISGPHNNSYSDLPDDQSSPRFIGNSSNIGHSVQQFPPRDDYQHSSSDMSQPQTSSDEQNPAPNVRNQTHFKELFDYLERLRNYHFYWHQQSLHYRHYIQSQLKRLQEEWRHYTQVQQDLYIQQKQCQAQLKHIQQHGPRQFNVSHQLHSNAIEKRIDQLEKQRLEQMRLQDLLLVKQNQLHQQIQEMDQYRQVNVHESLHQQFHELQCGIQQFYLQLEKDRREFHSEYEEQKFQLQETIRFENNEILRQLREFEGNVYAQIEHIQRQQEHENDFTQQLHQMQQDLLARVQELEQAAQEDVQEEQLQVQPQIVPLNVPDQIHAHGGLGLDVEMDPPAVDDRDPNALHYLEQGLQQWFQWIQQNPQPLVGHVANIHAMLENNPQNQLSLQLLVLQYVMNFRAYMKQIRRDVMTQHQINVLQNDRLERLVKQLQHQVAALWHQVANHHRILTQLQERQNRQN